MATFKQVMEAVIKQVFATQVASVAKQVEATAKQAIKQFCPNEQEVAGLVKHEVEKVISDVAKKLVYHLLGVEDRFGSQNYREYSDGLHLLASKFQPDIDALLRQTDLGKLMQEAMTSNLQKYQRSQNFKRAVKDIVVDRVNDLVNGALKEAASNCDFGNLTVDEKYGRVTVTLEKDGAVSSSEVEEEGLCL